MKPSRGTEEFRMTHSARMPFAVLLALSFILVRPLPLSAQTAPAPAPALGVLARGTLDWKGLPGFGENAIPSLYGEYRVIVAGAEYRVPVWVTTEPLFLNTQLWQASRTTPRYHERDSEPMDRELPDPSVHRLRLYYRVETAFGQSWSVLIAFPPAFANAAEQNRFCALFLERFRYFLVNSKTAQEFSLPAALGMQ